MLNSSNRNDDTEYPKLRVRPLEKKRSISIIGSLWAEGLKKKKKRWWETADVLVAFSILHSNAIVCRATYAPNGMRDKRDEGKKEQGGKKRRGVIDQKQNASKCGGRGKIAKEELRADGHPRCPPALPTCRYTKLRIRCFAICRPASMRGIVRYDTTRDGALSLRNDTPTIVIS